jgi:serine/threonine-protein kinase RsbW
MPPVRQVGKGVEKYGSAQSTMIPARLARMRDLRAFLEAFCAAAGIGREPCLRLNLVLEELFTNTVRHGHGGDSDAPVWVSLACGAGQVRMTYEDTGPPFNPYARLQTQSADDTLEMRKLGGLGVLLTQEMAKSRDYGYLFGRNRIRLSLAA